ncbi:MAG: amidohydrolase [Bacteroidales bacterium]|nr:amidohydrolase [Bacteroidales bacterium]
MVIANILLDGQQKDILVEGNRIKDIRPSLSAEPPRYAAFPGLINCHTHAAMTLLRGYGDDMPLENWLKDKIWPAEKHLDDETIYWGSRLACLEMIKSGTTCFNDMYFFQDATARAAQDSGLRAVLSLTGMDFYDPHQAEELKRRCLEWEKKIVPERRSATQSEGMLRFALAPHAIYTVSPSTLQWMKAFADEHEMLFHLHLAETQTEVDNCMLANGVSPVRYLHQLGLLSPATILAHGLWLTPDDIDLLGSSGAKVVHNPNSNLKLASGYRFLYNELCAAGVTVSLGTDGASSSNNLDLLEATKTMSLLQKGWRGDPQALPADEALRVATHNGAETLNLNAGELAPGRLADIILADLNNPAFTPCHNAVSNLVYSAHPDAIDTVIINGKIVMLHRIVKDEELIVNEARRCAQKLVK